MLLRSSHGFSILELLIVLALAAVVGAIAIPQIEGSLSATRLQTSATTFATELNFGRSMAVSRNSVFELEINQSQSSYQLVATDDPENPPRNEKTLDRGIIFNSVPGNTIRFFPRGNARSGTIQLSDGESTLDIDVLASGMVEIREVVKSGTE